ncbi:hypothetical protein A5893_01210 [Pedobacter psychrophilus]|uniref:Acyl-CoA dehydrogenase/oxidase C-terminal domain-containing protein n=1 Tax=Pedobacter psychrophilus TaxID=1826909 RepID=A0A179DMR8_9SPHI|nr:acyl-CoA dehydrogenase family protein [Pedobacter psychrophilus]OAQ41763.1 hypothetical protein A5893_01210 [Pedobacter psychrophilus]
MNNNLSTQFSDLIASAKDFIPLLLEEASETDAPNLFPEKSLLAIKDSDFLTACITSDFGGRNLGLQAGSNSALLEILQLIGSGNLVLGRVLEGHFNAQLLINQFATSEQKERFSKDAFEGRLFGVWNTQADDGVFIQDQNETYVLHGSKTFATGTGYVARPIVTATDNDGSWQMCIVPLDQVTAIVDDKWWNPMGMRATRSYKMNFNNIVIAKDNLLGNAGNYYQQPSFSGGSVRFSAVQLGGAEMIFKETVNYLKNLKRTEDQFQKMRIGEMAILIASGNQWINSAAVYLDNYMSESSSENANLFLNQTNMVRTAIDEICTKIMSLCQKCIGARGLNKPFHFERIIRDLNTYLRQPAPDYMLMEVGRFAFDNANSENEH